LLRNLKRHSSLLKPRLLRRVRATTPQTELPYPERLKNPDDAFAVKESLPKGEVLLVDDVMTTGSTLNAAARTLKAAGAERVSAWVLCRTLFEKT
jgi:predicted amidophosphoribosyltransferase